MKRFLRRGLLLMVDLGYRVIVRRLVFLLSPQRAHHLTLRLLAWLDGFPLGLWLLGMVHRLTFQAYEIETGGVRLPHPFIIGAGLVKGHGFTDEATALEAVASGENIIPGWRSVPQLVGLVEFGSFTRYPRMGNIGTVLWRDVSTRSTQNRVGLRNPGAQAAARFLAAHRHQLPACFGINLAISPGVDEPAQQCEELVASIGEFVVQGVIPSWFTINLSCPNTEDDPNGNQTESLTQQVCSEVITYLRSQEVDTPVWVKISPDLAPEQYRILAQVFQATGVQAVIASNTLATPIVDDPQQMAGSGGGTLHPHALAAVQQLMDASQQLSKPLDVIGCGGVLDGASYAAYRRLGVQVVHYWSALVYRGPLAAAIIEHEIGTRYASE